MSIKLRILKFLINNLLSEGCSYLICLAIDSRIDVLTKLIVENKYIDVTNTYSDISRLKVLRQLFSTKLYQ